MPDRASKDHKSFQLFLPLELHRRLKVKAAQEGTTITHLIVEAIRRALAEDDRQAPCA
jgi:predicted HicB family RNase H-like nuclease